MDKTIDLRFSQYIHGTWETLIKCLPDESIDCIYTDPPYGMNYLTNIPGSKQWNKNPNNSTKFVKPILNDNRCDIDWDLFAKEAYRVLKPNTYIVLHCNAEFLFRNISSFTNDGGCHDIIERVQTFSYKGMVAWNKKFAIGGDLLGAMKRDWEPIVYLAKGKPKTRTVEVVRDGKKVERKRISEIGPDWSFQLLKKEKTGFPTQKPSALCKQWIQLVSSPGNVVLDPFAGSGTIGRCASDLGRIGISFEADVDVFNKFCPKQDLQVQNNG